VNERVRELVVGSAASAARQGLAITACPYAAQDTPGQREMARLWVGAYLAARPPVHVAYDDEAAADDDEEGDPQLGRARDGHELHEYWTRGEGLARWVNDPHPFTTLLAFLRRHMPETKARKTAAEWFREVKGFLPSGRPPGQQDPEPAVDPVTLREQRERERRKQKRRTVRRTVDEDEVERANQLKEYWLRGEGAARWTTWTQLYNHLVEHVGSERAKRIAAEWYHERYGIWPGHKKGSNPTGPG
jgi:hypothetical protein